MSKILFLWLSVLGLFISSIPSFNSALAKGDSEEPARTMTFQKEITDYNRSKPLQNPRYEQSSDILKRRVIDSKNKVIGKIQDVLFNKNGRVSSLYVEFDRLSLNKSVYLNYNTLDIESVGNGYRLGFNGDEIETLYPVLLSGIEVASGDRKDHGAEIFSLKDLLGTTVIDSNGKVIAELQDVLFDNDGSYVRSVYLNINYKTVHNKGVAIPLSVLSFEEKAGKPYAVIGKAYVNSILEIAKKS